LQSDCYILGNPNRIHPQEPPYPTKDRKRSKKVLSRPSADSFAVGRRQKALKSFLQSLTICDKVASGNKKERKEVLRATNLLHDSHHHHDGLQPGNKGYLPRRLHQRRTKTTTRTGHFQEDRGHHVQVRVRKHRIRSQHQPCRASSHSHQGHPRAPRTALRQGQQEEGGHTPRDGQDGANAHHQSQQATKHLDVGRTGTN
jgi:hypothetical protein